MRCLSERFAFCKIVSILEPFFPAFLAAEAWGLLRETALGAAESGGTALAIGGEKTLGGAGTGGEVETLGGAETGGGAGTGVFLGGLGSANLGGLIFLCSS